MKKQEKRPEKIITIQSILMCMAVMALLWGLHVAINRLTKIINTENNQKISDEPTDTVESIYIIEDYSKEYQIITIKTLKSKKEIIDSLMQTTKYPAFRILDTYQ